MKGLEVLPIEGIPEVRPGDDLAGLIAEARQAEPLGNRDVLAVAHKVVSKAEGRVRDLATVTATARARELAAEHDKDPRALRAGLRPRVGAAPAIVVTDSFGRAWRHGITDVAIGVAGMDPVADYRGRLDPHGYPLEASVLAVADELASAAELVMGKTDGIPLAIVRGYSYSPALSSARELLMPPERDMFR